MSAYFYTATGNVRHLRDTGLGVSGHGNLDAHVRGVAPSHRNRGDVPALRKGPGR